MSRSPGAVAVFCGSNPGNQPAFTHAAQSLGYAVSKSGMTLVYGGGQKGIMGTVSEAVLDAAGSVIGVIPYAMVGDDEEIARMGGVSEDVREGQYAKPHWVMTKNRGSHGKVENIVVDSMHERKVEIAKRVGGFIGLPGGYGTFEELLEMITWSQLEIHNKPVILVNVLGFYNPLRDLIRSGIRSGFIQPQNEDLVVFVDGPSDMSVHETHDWGKDALNALNTWKRPEWDGYGYTWTKKLGGRDNHVKSPLEAS